MAPRPKVWLSRMDAALNFFLQMGFKRARVRKTINDLLKIYGGDGGWPFIEDSSYKVVLDALLEEDDLANALVENNVVDAPVEAESVEALIEHGSVVVSLEDVDVPLEEEADSVDALIEHRSVVACLEDVDVPLEDGQVLGMEHVNADLEDALLEHADSVLEADNMVSLIDDSKSVDIEDVGVEKLCAGQDADSSDVEFDDLCLSDIKVVGVRKMFTDLDANTANIDINLRKRKPCYGWLSDDEDEVLPKAPKKLVRLCIQ